MRREDIKLALATAGVVASTISLVAGQVYIKLKEQELDKMKARYIKGALAIKDSIDQLDDTIWEKESQPVRRDIDRFLLDLGLNPGEDI